MVCDIFAYSSEGVAEMLARESPTTQFDRCSTYCSVMCAKYSERVEGRLVWLSNPHS